MRASCITEQMGVYGRVMGAVGRNDRAASSEECSGCATTAQRTSSAQRSGSAVGSGRRKVGTGVGSGKYGVCQR